MSIIIFVKSFNKHLPNIDSKPGQRSESKLLPFLREHRKERERGEHLELYASVIWRRKHYDGCTPEVYLWHRGRMNATQESKSWVLKDRVWQCEG